MLIYHYFFILLITSNFMLCMDPSHPNTNQKNQITIFCGKNKEEFKIDNTEENVAILKTSKTISLMLEDTGTANSNLILSQQPITLPYISNKQDFCCIWNHMELLYNTTSKKESNTLSNLQDSMSQNIKKNTNKQTLLNLLNYSNALDVEHEKLNLLNIYCNVLAEQVDIKDAETLSELATETQTNLALSLINEICEYSHKIIRPSQKHSIDTFNRIQHRSFSQSGNIVIDSNSKNARIINAKTLEEIHKLTEHSDRITCVALSPDEKKAFTGSQDKTVKIWDIETGLCLNTFVRTAVPTAINCDDKGARLLCGYENGDLLLLDIESGDLIHTFIGHSSQINSIAFNKTDTQAITGSSDKTAKIWDLTNYQCIKSLPHQHRVNAVAFNRNSSQAVTSSFWSAFLWDLNTDNHANVYRIENKKYGLSPYIDFIEFSNNEKCLHANLDFCTHVWNVSNCKYLGSLTAKNINESGSYRFPIPEENNAHESLIKDINSLAKVGTNNLAKYKTNLALTCALLLHNIYQNYTNEGKTYDMQENSDAAKIMTMLNHESKKFLYQYLFIKQQDRPWYSSKPAQNIFKIFLCTSVLCLVYYLFAQIK